MIAKVTMNNNLVYWVTPLEGNMGNVVKLVILHLSLPEQHPGW